ncbi:MAG TPA: glycosyltransferase family 39 protein [Anaerolineales bacterium]|nr:glycosyltransferase family 39 protein [Anaerolineales bacterium]
MQKPINSSPQLPAKIALAVMVGLLLLTATLFGCVMRKDLPYYFEQDETTFIVVSLRMTENGTLNPGWFGNPGTTIIYPLAFFYRVLLIAQPGNWYAPAPEFVRQIEHQLTLLYLPGRIISTIYFLLSIWMVYQLALELTRKYAIAVFSAVFYTFIPLNFAYSQWIRTDAVGNFFVALSLLWMIRPFTRAPKFPLRWFLASSVALVLAVSSRYFMLALVPALCFAILLYFYNQLGLKPLNVVKNSFVWWFFCGVVVFCLFFLLNPFIPLDFFTFLADMKREGAGWYTGQPQLGRVGNAIWYFTQALPSGTFLGWGALFLMVVGLVTILRRKNNFAWWVVLSFLGLCVLGTCLLRSHWARHAIAWLPVLSILVAVGLDAIVSHLHQRLPALRWQPLWTFLVLAVGLLILPVCWIVRWQSAFSVYSNRIRMTEWAQANLPANSRIAYELHAISHQMPNMQMFDQTWIPPKIDLVEQCQEHIDYYITSGFFEYAYQQEPVFYAEQLDFYRLLEQHAELLYELPAQLPPDSFESTLLHGRYRSRIYRWNWAHQPDALCPIP